ncbi:serine/threonine-protein phosphatase 2A regulatory subunit B'' subunit alpha isoform X1 [Tachysurus fulvidraco]|uniref:serine/threonine-protein phosphatase 2A regulatory subunit B'' subunit alpha isoform X1 n=1 Tax=Tachysurus fulvidraco TaxID=1234273 RepID=UPI001FEFE74A|nr:serine/threonine-protein phosphatase 2A regulatory subunit B'' subunit alpha isoform X1 [Tachysurus fulvidraco]XP_027012480.2 serine/threonine-protein phosphatase 2A regulatory subunit B'' subunit alpha isoform X1 [Tachysurus fulvidraco]
MAATYRIVVSSINYYNSVVVDRRVQHTVHYCNGPCGAVKHGLSCTVAHRSTCAELLDSSQIYTDRSISFHESASKMLENGVCGHVGFGEDFHYQVLPRVKKGSAIQSSTSLKDITGEAINLASGKIKEFSFEKLKYSSSHVTFRKGRKVRPDSYSRRSADLDVIYGHFGNDENCPPQKSTPDEQKLNRSISLEQNLNNAASFYLNNLTEENLIARILEKTKTDSNASGEDIKACLDILLKCSEDLKKCTDIIKQCIKRKSMSGDGEDSGNPDAIYKTMMARLSGYLKRLPFDLDLGHTGRPEHSDLSELVNTLHGLQQRPFSPFGNEQPPRYEDVVQNPPSTTVQSNSLSCPSSESLDGTRDLPGNLTSAQGLAVSLSAHSSANELQYSNLTSSTSSTKPSSLHYPISTGRHDVSSLNSISKDTSMETLYIEEDADVGRAVDRKLASSVSESRQLSLRHEIISGLSAGNSDKLPDFSRNGTVYPPKAEPGSNQAYTPAHSNESKILSNSAQHITRDGVDEIDKLLMDLECLSQNMQKEPPLPPKQRQINAYQKNLHQIGCSGTKGLNPPTISSTKPTNRNKEEAGEEDDGAFLLRILESIESFAQELVDCGSETGTQSKEREVMRLLQGTLAKTDTNSENVPVPTPASTSETTPGLSPLVTATPVPVAVPSVTPANVVSPFIAGISGSTILIQQTPEVIRIQPEKKPVSPPPPPPIPRSPSPPPPAPPPPSINIPRFYFPTGLPNLTANIDEAIVKVEAAFAKLQEEKADIYKMSKIAKACGCPLYWKAPMFHCAGGDRTGFVSVHSFIATWRKLLHSCYDDASKFVYLLAKPGCTYLEQEDFIPLLQDIVDTHPGLTFLKDAPEFHSRYITTVIQRIFYTVNRSWTGRITMTELRRSNFLQTLALLEEEDDINQITDYFSYEHFYVIYCKFWELDTDHDLFIDPKDLSRYNDHASSSRIIERLFSGAVTRGNSVQREGRMSYAEFVWFLISEEDKKNPTSIEYWFRSMDLDGDGVLSMYELEFFYEEQCERMEGMGIEPLPFQDLLCQMLDLVKPESQGKITLRDLKRCRMAHIFFDTFFNLDKYLDHEQRDPFSVQKDVESEGPEPSDWDKYASEEYEILVAEETVSEHLHDGSFEDDHECEELPVTSDIGNKMDKLVISDLSP